MHRADYDREYDKQQAEYMRLMGLAVDILLFDSKGLFEEEIEEGNKYTEENPDLPDLATALVNMIAAGKNDPEHITGLQVRAQFQINDDKNERLSSVKDYN